jgi:hypothetical protein
MNPYPYEYCFLASLFATVFIETGVLLFLVKWIFKLDYTLTRLIFCGIACSGSTLPYLWFILPVFLPQNPYYIIVGEIGVTLIETTFYYFILNLNYKKSFLLSLVCNLTSFVIGLFLPSYFEL